MKKSNAWAAATIFASDDRCPECGFPIQPPELPLTMRLDASALRSDWPPMAREPRQRHHDEYRVEVYASGQTEAVDALAEQLEFRGISTAVSGSHTRTVDPISLMTVEHWDKKVAVWSGDVVRTTEIIQEFSEISVVRRTREAGDPAAGREPQSTP